MAGKYEFYDHQADPDDKHDHGKHGYEYDGSDRDAVVRHIGFEANAARPGESPTFNVSVSWKSAAAVVGDYFPVLAEDSGLKFSRDDTPPNTVRYSAYDATPADAVKLIESLAATKPVDDYSYAYPVIPPEAAAAMVERELQHLNLKPSRAGLVELEATHITGKDQELHGLKQPFSYLAPTKILHAGSKVSEIKEDAVPMLHPTGANGEIHAFDVTTVMTVPDKRTAELLALKVGGEVRPWSNKAQPDKNAGYAVRVAETTADEVLQKLGTGGDFIPQSVAAEIADYTHNLHPEQSQLHESAKSFGGTHLKNKGAATPAGRY